MHFGVVFHIQKIKELFVSFVLQHWLAMLQGVEQGGTLNKFPTFSPHHPISN
jgi:predicted component of type VI protein secretion system